MRVLRNVFEFITGGSIAAPLLVVIGITVTLISPSNRAICFAAFGLAAFIASVFERVQ